MKKHHVSPCSNHKNFARLDYFRTINPVIAEKLKAMLEEHRIKERGK